MTVADAARTWQAAGVSVIPIQANPTKRPTIEWARYQVEAPTLGQVDEWWGNGHPYGLAIICGAVSGNLEMTEIEAAAMTAGSMYYFFDVLDRLDARHVWDYLTSEDSGYVEMSPSGGMHLLYRVGDHDVPGNTKIASSEDRKTLAETRGEGGYVIVAPTTGICHPSGKPWVLQKGCSYGQVPVISWEWRNLLHEAMRLAWDRGWPAPTPAPVSTTTVALTDNTPGNAFEAETSWSEILGPHGWQIESRSGHTTNWTRPGKDRRDGASATTGRAADRDRLYVFSTSTIFQAEVPYTKFGAYALLNHNGDHSAAARELARQGFGDNLPAPAPLDELPWTPTEVAEVESEPQTEDRFSLDDLGNAQRLARHVKGEFRYIKAEKQYVGWDGVRWAPDDTGALAREMIRVTDEMLRSDVPAMVKWATKSRMSGTFNAAMKEMRNLPGITVDRSIFDQQRQYLNVQNGVVDVHTGELHAHDKKFMMTRVLGAAYDPQATCPRWDGFLAEAMPDETMRGYLQRAMGYTLLGEVDQRAMFWIYGPSGTGKSTFLETIRAVFGDYGVTAPSGTFRGRGKDSGPTNDVHMLRGRRFVATSETSEHTQFDEDLIKRMSGADAVTSRGLYQENQEWIPEATVWVATNNAPRFNSDDDAIWRRTKLIPFMTVFLGEGEVFGMSRKVLIKEASGILNWLLAGLRDFLAGGLQEPTEIRQQAKFERDQSNAVARFVDDVMADGALIQTEGASISSADLYRHYCEWARRIGERPVMNRRFMNKLGSLGIAVLDTSTSRPTWVGIGPGGTLWLSGRLDS